MQHGAQAKPERVGVLNNKHSDPTITNESLDITDNILDRMNIFNNVIGYLLAQQALARGVGNVRSKDHARHSL